MAKPMFEYSAGGVALNDGQVLLIRSRALTGRTVWAFPKGKLNQGETSEQAALREVGEETGWRCTIEAELPRSEYWYQRDGQRIKKTVRWYRMVPVEQVGVHDHEIEEVAWVSFEEAMTRLTYPSDRELLRTATAGVTTPGEAAGS
ncbi:MAG: NUDIX hydrolase [Nitrospirales bacterium]